MSAKTNQQTDLNRMSSAAANAKLGTIIVNLITALNALTTAHNDLATKHNALVAHLDVAAVTGIGTGNTAAYGGTSAALSQVADLGTYR